MADNDVDVNEELLDYEDDPETETPAAEAGAENGATKQEGKVRFDCTEACIHQSSSSTRSRVTTSLSTPLGSEISS